MLAALITTFPLLLFAKDFPAPSGYVNDFANVINADAESRITRIADAVEKATAIEFAVVTVPTLKPYGSIEQYSIALATEWGIGKKEKDNGMLLLLALEERKLRIEVGYGLEGIFTDAMVGRIMDQSMVPYFKNNDFSTGFYRAVEGISGVIEKEYKVELSGVSAAESQKYTRVSSRSSQGRRSPLYIAFVIIFVFGGRFLWPMLFLGGMGRRRYTRGGFFGGFGGGGGGGGGGFSGFGGGGFGGGGASRSF